MYQISSRATKNVADPTSSIDAAHDDRLAERDAYDAAMLRFISDMELSSMYAEKISPHPMLMPRSFIDHLEEFQRLLFVAISNILDRWWEDSDADFPGRMPLESHEESVLKVGTLLCSLHHKPYNNQCLVGTREVETEPDAALQ